MRPQKASEALRIVFFDEACEKLALDSHLLVTCSSPTLRFKRPFRFARCGVLHVCTFCRPCVVTSCCHLLPIVRAWPRTTHRMGLTLVRPTGVWGGLPSQSL